LQPLERAHQHTQFLLEHLRAYRQLFTTITILTKNPVFLCEPNYRELVLSLAPLRVEVACPFFRDEARRYYEPAAPPVQSRLEGIRALRDIGVSVSLRIDPIFPKDPLPQALFGTRTMADYNIGKGQREEDLEELIGFASSVGCQRIIVSPLKLVVGRFGRSALNDSYLPLFRDACGGHLVKKGTSYRLPWSLYHDLIRKPVELARSKGIEMIYCKDNLTTTP
jgi:DNA repair photolyase